ncbi:MAG: CRISPR-associated endonuclease Cas2 [Pseudomonadota bacterium]
MTDPQPWLLAYDVSDDRRRVRLFKLLKSYGMPLQRSLFLCYLSTVQKGRLLADLADFQWDTNDCVHVGRVASLARQDRCAGPVLLRAEPCCVME